MATNADFIKDIWKEVVIAVLWYKIKYTLETVGTTDTTLSCFHLAAFPEKPTSFTTKRQTEFLEWACLKDLALPHKSLSFGPYMMQR